MFDYICAQIIICQYLVGSALCMSKELFKNRVVQATQIASFYLINGRINAWGVIRKIMFECDSSPTNNELWWQRLGQFREGKVGWLVGCRLKLLRDNYPRSSDLSINMLHELPINTERLEFKVKSHVCAKRLSTLPGDKTTNCRPISFMFSLMNR